MNAVSPLVTVVDDDESVRESLPDLLKEFGYRVEAFSSAESFLALGNETGTGCLILDVAMPGMTGPELLRLLRSSGQNLPVIFITAHRDESVRRRLLADGAVDCLYKPFSDAALQRALDEAFRSA
jgi:FixJ family two-component response regulator